MRKAALASTLTLVLNLTATPTVLNGLSSGSAPRDVAGLGYVATATDWIYPVGDPRGAPTLDPGNANGYWITQIFNNSCDPSLGQGYYYAGQYFCGHTGVDLYDGQAGGVVHATANGLVVYAGNNASFGNMVRLQHVLPDGSYIYSQYEHMLDGSLQVVPGQVVAMGQSLGLVGATGFATGPHLHFEIKSVDDDGVGYTFGNPALLYGYFDPLAFIAAHTQWVAPTPTPLPPPATATPVVPLSTPVGTTAPLTAAVVSATAPLTAAAISTTAPLTASAAISATVPRTEGRTASMGGEQRPVLATFYKRYHAFVVVTADHLNVRTGSGFRFAPLNSATRGARLAYLGMTGNGWVHVALPSDIVGYVARQWVRGAMLPQLPPIQMSDKLRPPFVTVLDTRYPARNRPMMHAAAIEPLRRGEKLTYLGTLTSWDKVILPTGRIGWVLNWYLLAPRVSINLNPVRQAPVAAPAAARSGHRAVAATRKVAITGPYVVAMGDGLRLRAGPRLAAPVIEGLAAGTRLSFRGYHTSWIAVIAPDGAQGYVLGRYVRLVGTAMPHPAAHRTPPATRRPVPLRAPSASGNRAREAMRRVVITGPYVVAMGDGLRLRAGPRLAAPVIEVLAAGTKLNFRGYHTSWVAVVAPDGTQGYVLGRYVHVVATAPPHPAAHRTPPAARRPLRAPGVSRSPRHGAAAGLAVPFLVVAVPYANLRAGPSLKALVVVAEPYNTRLAFHGAHGQWVHVETQKGVVGWMMRSLTRPG